MLRYSITTPSPLPAAIRGRLGGTVGELSHELPAYYTDVKCSKRLKYFHGVREGIWLASFMHYDLGYFDLEQKTLQPLDNPLGTRLHPRLGTFRYLCVRAGQHSNW